MVFKVPTDRHSSFGAYAAQFFTIQDSGASINGNLLLISVSAKEPYT